MASTRTPLTVARLVQAALEVLDEAGIDAVTVRNVAARLGVQAPALYRHVRDKQQLLDEMGTEIQRRVVTAVAEQRPSGDLAEDLAVYARALRSEYLAHRDGARTFSGTRLTDGGVLRAQEPFLQAMTDGGHELSGVVDAAEMVTAFVVGFVIEEQERADLAEGRYTLEDRDTMVGEGAPLAKEAGHLRDGSGARFERQLGMVLAAASAAARVAPRST